MVTTSPMTDIRAGAADDRAWGLPALRGWARTVPGAAYLLALLVIALAFGTRGFLSLTNITNIGLQADLQSCTAPGYREC